MAGILPVANLAHTPSIGAALTNRIALSSGTSGGAAAQAFQALLNIVVSHVTSAAQIRPSLSAKKGAKDCPNTRGL